MTVAILLMACALALGALHNFSVRKIDFGNADHRRGMILLSLAIIVAYVAGVRA